VFDRPVSTRPVPAPSSKLIVTAAKARRGVENRVAEDNSRFTHVGQAGPPSTASRASIRDHTSRWKSAGTSMSTRQVWSFFWSSESDRSSFTSGYTPHLGRTLWKFSCDQKWTQRHDIGRRVEVSLCRLTARYRLATVENGAVGTRSL
jgi:hypothetical protein